MRQLGGRGWEEEVNKLGTVCGGVGLAPHGLLCFRLGKMSFFSSWMKVIFTVVLLFFLHSESAFSRKSIAKFPEPNCEKFRYGSIGCTLEWRPVCATNHQSYSNPCFFCRRQFESGDKFRFHHYGKC
ncbi:sperm-associated acrosin inhibitor-like [Equus asinus]|uniref:Kazal-like domain-containing protein n=1 Tax=Equus asinus TaxID=9793 RepID=A0A9L0J8W5_EQUAS|nr:sperm-associated acrosin inhibitor-like [Equus asinus]XP_044599741.1 sperm-associated acrosin inhibitor-like [Equus asinus]